MKGYLTTEQRLKQVVTRLKNENIKLKERVAILEKENTELKQQLQYVMLQVEDLKIKVFGKRKSWGRSDDNHPATPQQRTPQSYRRPIPKDTDITETKTFPIDHCTQCHTPLQDIRTTIRYVEDILAPSEWYRVIKQVTRQHIETGYCPLCRKRVSLIPIAKQLVALGTNVRQFVSYADVILRLSYGQISHFLSDMMRFTFSDGELTNILHTQAQTLMPAYERLKETIRYQQGVHYDETSWKVQSAQQGNYAWVMTGTETVDAVFLIGASRGKGNAEELRGDQADHVGISDDYGVYKNLFTRHQLCWAHPLRKLRDLASSDTLTAAYRQHCRMTYESFAQLYRQVRMAVARPFVDEERIRKKEEFLRQLERIAAPHEYDPLPLQKLKTRLQEQKECYLACIEYDGIPPDNNKAERALRHLVLKRKSCFGSKTQDGADTMSVLASVLLSLWWKSRDTFFKEYTLLLNSA